MFSVLYQNKSSGSSGRIQGDGTLLQKDVECKAVLKKELKTTFSILSIMLIPNENLIISFV